MRAVVEQDVDIDDILARADQNIARGNFRKVLHQPLRPRAHAVGGHGGHEEDVRDLAQILDELLRALDHRLIFDEFRVFEIGEPLVGKVALQSPGTDMVGGQHRQISVFVAQQL